MTDIGFFLQRDAGRDHRRALDGGADHGRHVGVAERHGLGRHRLDGHGRAAALLDLEVDTLGGKDPLLLAVVERRVLAINVPVEQQHDLVGGLRRDRKERCGERRGRDGGFQQNSALHRRSSV
jgi:hypothetical protein